MHFQVIEGQRRRVQVFEGIVLKRQGAGVRETFTVRKQSFGVGVERTFPVHSPKIERIEVTAIGDVNRAKLYYLRGKVGKRARVRAEARGRAARSRSCSTQARCRPRAERSTRSSSRSGSTRLDEAEPRAAAEESAAAGAGARGRSRSAEASRARAGQEDESVTSAGRRLSAALSSRPWLDAPAGSSSSSIASSARASSPAPTRPGAGRSPGRCSSPGVLLDYAKLRDHAVRPLACLNDSKQCSEGRARELYRAVLGCAERVVVRAVPPGQIDRAGLHRSNLAGLRAVLAELTPPAEVCLVDGFRLGPRRRSTARSWTATRRARRSRRPRSSPR